MSTKVKAPKWAGIMLIIAIAIVGIWIIVDVISGKTDASIKENSILSKPWNEMAFKERETWIESYMKNPDDAGYELIGKSKKAIKNQFKYSETVDLNQDPNFINPSINIVEADSGWVFCSGTGTAKNGFGVKGSFHYSIKWEITPYEKSIIDVSVSEDN